MEKLKRVTLTSDTLFTPSKYNGVSPFIYEYTTFRIFQGFHTPFPNLPNLNVSVGRFRHFIEQGVPFEALANLNVSVGHFRHFIEQGVPFEALANSIYHIPKTQAWKN